MYYDIACKNCNYKTTWEITLAEYEKMLRESCPKCKKIGLYQDFSKRKTLPVLYIGYGWSTKSVRKGSDDELNKVLDEHDYLKKKSDKHDHIDERVAKGYKEERINERKTVR